MGISLHDMKVICGLPILGDVQYEEFIPQNKDLQQNRMHPPTVAELLKIHSQLCTYHNQSIISWAQWIGHFYREKIIYKAFADGKRKPLDQTLRAPEITLRISNEGRLAAFLAFWLSRFVLPSVDRDVRPETFYMACLMAQGVRVSLAPTVLGYIYHGLGEIATHSEGPGLSSASFPIHYVIGWLGEHIPGLYVPQTDREFVKDYPFLVRYAGAKPKYFRLNRARIIFRSDKDLIYRPTTFIEDEGRSFADTKDLSDRKFEFLVCTRSTLLPVRVNNKLWLEPYYPNRFARQFGFDQGVPSNKLSFNVRDRHKCGIEDLARAQITLLRRDTTTGFYIPRSTYIGACTWWYCKWWMRSTAPYMGLSVARIFLPSGRRLERRDNVFVVRPKNPDPTGCPKETSNKRPSSCSDNNKSPKRTRSQNFDHPVDDGVSSPKADGATLMGDTVFLMNEDPSEQGSTTNFPNATDNAQDVSNEPNDAIGAPDESNEPNDAISALDVSNEPNDGISAHDVSNEPNETDDVVEDDCPLPLAEYLPSSPYVKNFIHHLLGPSVAPRRRRFIAEEMQDVFDRISSSKSPIDLLAHRDHIFGALGLLRPMINTLESGQDEFQQFETTIQHIFELATSFSKNVAFVGEYAHVDVDRINALITQYEQCFATIETMNLQLTELNGEIADVNATEADVEKAEKEAEEAAKRAREMRQHFESKTRALKERAKDLQRSLDQQFGIEIGLRQARIDANEAMLPKLIEARNLGFSQEKEIRQLVSSLISLCSRVE